jgi:hypothetical protein
MAGLWEFAQGFAEWTAGLVVFMYRLAGWIFTPSSWVPALRSTYAAFLAVVYQLLPSEAQTALAAFVTKMLADNAVIGVVELAWYCLDIFINPTVVAVCIGLYLLLWPACLGIRLGLMLYHQFWGAN